VSAKVPIFGTRNWRLRASLLRCEVIVILAYEELSQYRSQVVMVDGAFDPLHAGHVEYFSKARQLGRRLLCNVASDEYVRSKHPLLLPSAQRVAVIDAIRDIAYTHANDTDTETVLWQLRPYAYVKGKDWEGRLPQRHLDVCRHFGIRIVFVETVTESSTRLIEAVRNVPRGAPTSASLLGSIRPGS
jgi:cytidyltransferase-like protein